MQSLCFNILHARVMAYFTSRQDFFFSNSQSKKFELTQKFHVPEPFVSRAKAPPAKGSEKGYGDWGREGVLYVKDQFRFLQ